MVVKIKDIHLDLNVIQKQKKKKDYKRSSLGHFFFHIKTTWLLISHSTMIPSSIYFKIAYNSTRAAGFAMPSSRITPLRLFTTAPIKFSQRVVQEEWTKTLAEKHYCKTEGGLSSKDELGDRFVVTWEHPKVTCAETREITIAHHQPKTLSDRIAQTVLLVMRQSFDIVSGYKHPPKGQENNPKYIMTEKQWLQRFVFLESIAGVPGMVGGMVRHLHSLRLMRRDKAWIETLLEEAYNERMHLLTFIKLLQPGYFMRGLLLAAQGIFFNLFFAAYLVFPRVCHRFVGYLEEEAVVTYTRCIEDIEAGRLPQWNDRPAPQVAIAYWDMPKNATMLDLIYYVRADEAKHREVNHTFGNLDQKHDRNPYALRVVDSSESPKPQPSLDLSAPKPTGWERSEIAA